MLTFTNEFQLTPATDLRMRRYLDVNPLAQILYWHDEGLVPYGVQVFMDHFALKDALSVILELHVRVAGT